MGKKKYSHFRLQIACYVLDMAPCPKCGSQSKKNGAYTRTPMNVGIDNPVLLSVKVSTHKCPNGCGYFSACPPFLKKYHQYTQKAIEKAVQSVQEDKVSITQTTLRMERDFHLHPAKSTIWKWRNQQADGVQISSEYEEWVVASFSGVLCIDEVYDGAFAVVFATDPITNILVGHLVHEGHITQSQIREFLLHLKGKGIRVNMLISDDSNLYTEELIKEVFPDAEHQLCRFHVIRKITKECFKAIKQIRDEISNSIPQLPLGRPSMENQEIAQKAKELREHKREIFQNRHLFVKRQENLTEEEKKNRDRLCARHPALALIVMVMMEIYKLFDSPDYQTAQLLFEKLANSEYASHPLTKRIIEKIMDKKTFEKSFTFLRLGISQKTNNHVERQNRRFRKVQKSCSKLRKKYTIEIAINLDKQSSIKKRMESGLRYQGAGPPVKAVA